MMKVSIVLLFGFCLTGALAHNVTQRGVGLHLGSEVDLDALENELANLLIGIYNQTINAKHGIVINSMVDKMFAHVSNIILHYKLDSIPVPEESFKAKHALHGSIHDGTLRDLHTIHRTANVIFTYDPKVKKVVLQFPFGFDDLKVHYDINVKSKLFKTHGRLDGSIKNIHFNPTLSFNYNSKTLTLDHFDMKSTGAISVRIHISKAINWLINAISKVATHTMHPRIVRELQSKVGAVLSKSIVRLNQDIKKKIHI